MCDIFPMNIKNNTLHRNIRSIYFLFIRDEIYLDELNLINETARLVLR